MPTREIVELSGAAMHSWQVLADRFGVPAGQLVRAVGLYLLDFEQLTHEDVPVVVSLARGLEPEPVDLRDMETETVIGALNAAVEAVDRAKRLLEDIGSRDAARYLGEAQPSLHDARRAFRAGRPPLAP